MKRSAQEIQTHICASCEAFVADRWAHPELGERHGSTVICDDGIWTHSGRWCPRWRQRTAEQDGRLF